MPALRHTQKDSGDCVSWCRACRAQDFAPPAAPAGDAPGSMAGALYELTAQEEVVESLQRQLAAMAARVSRAEKERDEARAACRQAEEEGAAHFGKTLEESAALARERDAAVCHAQEWEGEARVEAMHREELGQQLLTTARELAAAYRVLKGKP